MSTKSYAGPLKHIDMFSRKLPNAYILLLILLAIGFMAGFISVSLVSYKQITNLGPTLVGGLLAGILALLLPALLTVITFKIMRRYVATKYILFVTLLGTVTYALFMIIASAIYSITGAYSISIGIIVVAAASLFGWWIFMNKILLDQKLRSAPLALIQPILNVLFFIPASKFIFVMSTPITFLLERLFAGISVFLVVSYVILYVVDAPLKQSLGISGIDMFSQMLQDWLFKINTSFPVRGNKEGFGRSADIEARALVAKDKSNKVKAIMFIPDLHYGLSGLLGSSNFPYLLEKHGNSKYGAPTFVMHTAINEDYNAVSSDQYPLVRNAFDRCMQNATRVLGGMRYEMRTYKEAKVSLLGFGDTGVATLTRAPKVTEDLSYGAGIVIRQAMEGKIKNPIVIDAHNSRYESASVKELANIDIGSNRLSDYLGAVKLITRPQHRSRSVNLGISSIQIATRLGNPDDLAPGALNIAVFSFNSFRYGMLHFNANNVSPSFREGIREHVEKKYRIDAEVYTTDSHYTNSLRHTASNVLGKSTKLNRLLLLVDEGIESALSNVEPVQIYYHLTIIENFKIWGANQRDKAIAAVSSMISVAKILVPVIIVMGFLVASLVISFI